MTGMLPFLQRDTALLETSRKEQHAAIEHLIGQSTARSGYYLFLALAAAIATPGLLHHAIAVIIGGMVLAPLMSPLLSLSLSIIATNVQGLFRSLRILLLSIVLVVVIAATITLVLKQADAMVSWIPEQIDVGTYAFIALCSGVAGAFAMVKERLAPVLPGIAMAVSLLPPLCSAGIALALQDMSLLRNSLLLFLANTAGICIGALVVFLLLQFAKSADVEERAVRKAEKEESA